MVVGPRIELTVGDPVPHVRCGVLQSQCSHVRCIGFRPPGI
jgi:hypothetical protein